jgi:hypothetical protein
MRRVCAALALTVLLAAAPAAGAYPSPPHVPSSTHGTKHCGVADKYGYPYRFYITKGRHRITCKRAKRLLDQTNPAMGRNPRHWVYFDWTKAGGGPGPWSDVWMRRGRKVVVCAIIETLDP